MLDRRKRGVSIRNSDELAAWLEEVNRRAKSWTANFEMIREWSAFAEARLATDGVPVRSRVGVEIVALTGGPSTVAYKYPVIGSSVRLRRFRDGWRMMSLQRLKRYPRQKEQVRVLIHPGVSDALLKKQKTRYHHMAAK